MNQERDPNPAKLLKALRWMEGYDPKLSNMGSLAIYIAHAKCATNLQNFFGSFKRNDSDTIAFLRLIASQYLRGVERNLSELTDLVERSKQEGEVLSQYDIGVSDRQFYSEHSGNKRYYMRGDDSMATASEAILKTTRDGLITFPEGSAEYLARGYVPTAHNYVKSGNSGVFVELSETPTLRAASTLFCGFGLGDMTGDRVFRSTDSLTTTIFKDATTRNKFTKDLYELLKSPSSE